MTVAANRFVSIDRGEIAMKGFFGKVSFIKMCVLVSGVILLFSCSNESDMREATKAQIGEPDLVQAGGSGPYQYQIFVYANKDINRVYEYRKSASGCGSQGQWYVYQVYPADYLGYTLYTPPAIVHTQVKTAEPGKNLVIAAKVTDDGQVITVILFYRKPGATDYQPITMNPESDSYIAEIPAEQATTAGIQYYIEATDNGQHKSRLPIKDFYLVTIKETVAP
jgi:hypothetical protein